MFCLSNFVVAVIDHLIKFAKVEKDTRVYPIHSAFADWDYPI